MAVGRAHARGPGGGGDPGRGPGDRRRAGPGRLLRLRHRPQQPGVRPVGDRQAGDDRGDRRPDPRRGRSGLGARGRPRGPGCGRPSWSRRSSASTAGWTCWSTTFSAATGTCSGTSRYGSTTGTGGLRMLQMGVHTHLITCQAAIPLMLRWRRRERRRARVACAFSRCGARRHHGRNMVAACHRRFRTRPQDAAPRARSPRNPPVMNSKGQNSSIAGTPSRFVSKSWPARATRNAWRSLSAATCGAPASTRRYASSTPRNSSAARSPSTSTCLNIVGSNRSRPATSRASIGVQPRRRRRAAAITWASS